MTIQGVSATQASSGNVPQLDELTLPAPVLAAMLDHARAGSPEEVCGIVRGKDLQAFEAIRARNVASERIQNYTVDPQILLRQFEFEDAGEAMVAIYHSHPVSPAYPSATDAWNATYPDAVYLIISLEDETNPVVRGWALVAEDVTLDLDALRTQIPFFAARTGLWGYHQGTDMPALASLQTTIAPPYYIVYMLDQTGDLVDARLVSVREHPIRIV